MNRVDMYVETLFNHPVGSNPAERLYYLESLLMYTDRIWNPSPIDPDYIKGLNKAIALMRDEVADYILLGTNEEEKT